ASCLVSAGVICGRSSGTRWPCTRTCGGELVVMCKSLPDISNILFNKSLNESAMFAGSLPQTLVNGFAGHFFECRNPFRDFGQTTAAQSKHAPLNGLSFQFQGRSAHEHEFLDFVVHFHDFVKSTPPLVASVIACCAAFALADFYRFGFFGSKPFSDQRFLRDFDFFRAVLANA